MNNALLCPNSTHFSPTPAFISEERLEAKINLDALSDAPRHKGQQRKQPPRQYLLIGFDTEYQTHGVHTIDETKTGVENDLLSYQYTITIIDQDHIDQKHDLVSGMIIPEDDKRIKLEEFMTIVVAEYQRENPGLIVPHDAYLIGHFNKADLCAFDSYQDVATKYLNNVRNTFVSVDRSMSIRFKGEKNVKLKLILRDTFLLAPEGMKSLAQIGEICNLEKIKLHDDPDKELHIKENMKDFMTSNWESFKDYSERDSEVCVVYAHRLLQQLNFIQSDFKLPITLTSIGTQQLLKTWSDNNIKPDDALGREAIKERAYSKKLGYYLTKTNHPYIDLVHWNESFAVECYHGGRNEQFMFGPSSIEHWYDVDLSSAYTTAMATIGQPNWENLTPLLELGEPKHTDLSLFTVDFEFPRHIRFPCLPVRTDYGLIFPRTGRSNCCAAEVRLALDLGANIKFRRGVHVPMDRSVGIFEDFIRTCIQRRGQHAKGTFDNLFWKEIGNSTYGKIAQGLKKRRVYDLRSAETVELTESAITQPFFAAYITSFTRAVLGEVMNKLPDETKVFSVTTDGFLSTASLDEALEAAKGPLASAMMAKRQELMGDNHLFEVKHEVKQVIGWRTRGSATLMEGHGKDPIVLQKGGVKLNRRLDERQQNREMIKLFLEREPDQECIYDIGIGIRSMMEYGGDFVSQERTKRLSMEYDWKRRPTNAADMKFHFGNDERTHLSFSSKPVESAEEFKFIREQFERYSRNPSRVIKTLDDVNNFKRFVKIGKLPKTVTAYMKKGPDGDISRLRRDLCRAYQHRKAGFDKFLNSLSGKFKHNDFVKKLQDVGLDCKISDVDNAKKPEFTKHQTAATDRVKTILNELKEKHFPQLCIEDLLIS